MHSTRGRRTGESQRRMPPRAKPAWPGQMPEEHSEQGAARTHPCLTRKDSGPKTHGHNHGSRASWDARIPARCVSQRETKLAVFDCTLLPCKQVSDTEPISPTAESVWTPSPGRTSQVGADPAPFPDGRLADPSRHPSSRRHPHPTSSHRPLASFSRCPASC